MKIQRTKNTGMGFLGLLELLLAVSITLFLAYRMYKGYLKSPIANKEVEKTANEQGIDTSSAKTVIDSAKQKLRDIDQQSMDRMRELEGAGK